MTSSLVGSEMCIRDSANFLRVVQRQRHLRAGDMLAAFEKGRKLPTTLLTVSYTHLTLPTICSV
eukprot:7807033-Prorocentrum_lima.AAC.1